MKQWYTFVLVGLAGFLTILSGMYVGSYFRQEKEAEPIPQTPSAKVEKPDNHVEAFKDVLLYHCTTEKVPYPIMESMAQVESDWDRWASNGKDFGLWQLNGRYIEYFAWKFNDGETLDPFDVWDSTKVACRYMAWLYRQTGSWRKEVMAYNCGLSRLQTAGPPESTVRYAELVFAFGIECGSIRSNLRGICHKVGIKSGYPVEFSFEYAWFLVGDLVGKRTERLYLYRVMSCRVELWHITLSRGKASQGF